MSLEILPPEILKEIVEYVGEEDPRALLNLIYVSKTLSLWGLHAGKAIFFHDVKLSLGPRNIRSEAVVSLTDMFVGWSSPMARITKFREANGNPHPYGSQMWAGE
ncbi:hypothetical protein N7512_000826 [Penicillium capsulatum]|nr:hypothetical protein N7512_000826 [Penicillium capsulatum]